MTDIIKIVTNTSLLDWVVTSFNDGEGDVDAKHGFFDDEEMDMDFNVDVWQ